MTGLRRTLKCLKLDTIKTRKKDGGADITRGEMEEIVVEHFHYIDKVLGKKEHLVNIGLQNTAARNYFTQSHNKQVFWSKDKDGLKLCIGRMDRHPEYKEMEANRIVDKKLDRRQEVYKAMHFGRST